jgi:hypothetical protein
MFICFQQGSNVGRHCSVPQYYKNRAIRSRILAGGDRSGVKFLQMVNSQERTKAAHPGHLNPPQIKQRVALKQSTTTAQLSIRRIIL